MEVIYSLIPGMIFLGLIMVGILVWAVRRGQYEDFEGDGQRILLDEDEPTKKRANDRYWPDAD
jgi:cbb3-type cytochrome oxidase maturation protein